jgi:Na+-translocating ferredoxin:NAD+ oxidoreductase RnfC subunit
MAQFGVPRIYGSGLPIMRTLQNQPTAEADNHLRVRTAEKESELALLAQFMRHDSVASLAKAIAKRTGVRSGDLIAAAGLDPSRTDR